MTVDGFGGICKGGWWCSDDRFTSLAMLETSDDELLGTGRKRGESFSWLPPALAGPGSGLTSLCGA